MVGNELLPGMLPGDNLCIYKDCQLTKDEHDLLSWAITHQFSPPQYHSKPMIKYQCGAFGPRCIYQGTRYAAKCDLPENHGFEHSFSPGSMSGELRWMKEFDENGLEVTHEKPELTEEEYRKKVSELPTATGNFNFDKWLLTGDDGCVCHIDTPNWCRAHLSKWPNGKNSCDKVISNEL